jgi:hypothetical protein
MELHPDDRPETTEDLRKFLLGTRELPVRPMVPIRTKESISSIINRKPEQILILTVAGLFIISLIASLIP